MSAGNVHTVGRHPTPLACSDKLKGCTIRHPPRLRSYKVRRAAAAAAASPPAVHLRGGAAPAPAPAPAPANKTPAPASAPAARAAAHVGLRRQLPYR